MVDLPGNRPVNRTLPLCLIPTLTEIRICSGWRWGRRDGETCPTYPTAPWTASDRSDSHMLFTENSRRMRSRFAAPTCSR